jgi:hypothetical protein
MLERDLEHVLLFLAGHEDAVLLRHRPGDEYLRTLQAAGYEVPEIYEDPGERAGVSAPLTVPATLRERKLGDLRPWGRGPDSLARLGPLFAAVVGQRGAELRERGAGEYLAMSDFYARPCALKIARAFVESRNVAGGDSGRLVAPGRACTEVADALGAVEELRAKGAPFALLKAFFGTAGRNRLHWRFASSVNPPGAAPDAAPLIEWIERALARYGGVVVEAWFERVADYSVQLTVELDGAVTVHGVTRLFNDPAGRYRATLVGRIFDLLTPAQRRTRADPVQGIIPVLGDVARFAGRQLAARGYRGPAGIDAFAFRETPSAAAPPDRLALRPLVEINPRYTMGRVALEIGKRVRAHRAALWCTITRRECRAAGFADFPALAAHFRDQRPLTFSGDLIDGGVLCTADPARARERLTLLCVAPDEAGCLDQLSAAGLSFLDR